MSLHCESCPARETHKYYARYGDVARQQLLDSFCEKFGKVEGERRFHEIAQATAELQPAQRLSLLICEVCDCRADCKQVLSLPEHAVPEYAA